MATLPFDVDNHDYGPLDAVTRHVGPLVRGQIPESGDGVAQPLDFAKALRAFDERAVKRILHDNCAARLGASRVRRSRYLPCCSKIPTDLA